MKSSPVEYVAISYERCDTYFLRLLVPLWADLGK